MRIEGGTLCLTRALEDTIAILGRYAEAEYRVNRTNNTRAYTQDRDIKE